LPDDNVLMCALLLGNAQLISIDAFRKIETERIVIGITFVKVFNLL
jgi:hypothetical protein